MQYETMRERRGIGANFLGRFWIRWLASPANRTSGVSETDNSIMLLKLWTWDPEPPHLEELGMTRDQKHGNAHYALSRYPDCNTPVKLPLMSFLRHRLRRRLRHRLARSPSSRQQRAQVKSDCHYRLKTSSIPRKNAHAATPITLLQLPHRPHYRLSHLPQKLRTTIFRAYRTLQHLFNNTIES